MVLLMVFPVSVFAEGEEPPAEEPPAAEEGSEPVEVELDPSPTIEPTQEEPAAEESEEPVEVALDPTPTIEPVEDQTGAEETPEPEDLCPNDDNKLKPGICGCGKPDLDSDEDGILNCKDSCPDDPTNSCAPAPEDAADGTQEITSDSHEETAELEAESEDLAEIVDVLNEQNVQVVGEDGQPLALASEEAAEILTDMDPFFWNGSEWIGYTVSGSGCPANVTCNASPTPFQAAVTAAGSGTTIYVASGNYAEDVVINTPDLSFVAFHSITVDASSNSPTLYNSGYAVVDQITLNVDFGTTAGVYADYVVVNEPGETGGRLDDALALVDHDGRIEADVVIYNSGGTKRVKDKNHPEINFEWECGEPNEVIHLNRTYRMILMNPLDPAILAYYEAHGDERSTLAPDYLDLTALERIEDLEIAFNLNEGSEGWSNHDEERIYWYLLGNIGKDNNNTNIGLNGAQQVKADEVVDGIWDAIARNWKVWFMWPILENGIEVSPENRQLTFFPYDPAPVPGCTDPDAVNYDPNATEDNGKCVYDRCVNLEGVQEQVPAGYADIGDKLCVPIVNNLNLTSECWEDESTHTMRVTNPNSFPVPYTWQVYGTSQSGSGTASPGLSYFTITGTHGQANTTKLFWFDHTGTQKSKTKAVNQNFCTPDVCDNLEGYQKEIPEGYEDIGDRICEIPGCTDPTAWNFDQSATFDDDSCVYDQCVNIDGLQEQIPEGYEDIGDGVCEYLGCTDDRAYNFNPDATLDDGSCEWCGDREVNGEEDCDGQDYCTEECSYKPFASLVLDPHCAGVGALAWSVFNPNPYPVPNVQVVVDGVLKHDGAFPANTSLGMGNTPDGPASHIMVVTWPNQGFATSTSREVCEPAFVPPPVAAPIPVTGEEEFIIPVTGVDPLAVALAQQRMLIGMGAALLGSGLIIGGRKRKK